MYADSLNLDSLADAWEEQCRQGPPPTLDTWLARVPPEHRVRLAELLIPIELEYRHQRSEPLDAELIYGDLPPPILDLAKRCLAELITEETEPESRLSNAERAGELIDQFRLDRLLGHGGMGEVWVAEQTAPVQRIVALKLIKRGLGSQEVLSRFSVERQALALMNHPHIAQIYDAGTTRDGRPFIAMEWVDGLPLTTYCDRRHLGLADRLRLFLQVCSGVQHAHQKGIIHRDLKPSNIIVGQENGLPVPKIIDFGLAKATERTGLPSDLSQYTGQGQVLGTLKYMSPEQAGLKNLDIDTRTDIYALGVILYELLTGTTPLPDDILRDRSWLGMLECIRELDPVRPSLRLRAQSASEQSSVSDSRQIDSGRLSRILRGDLDWIVMKALEKDRNRRYESASEFAADISRFLQHEPVHARPPSLGYRIRKFVRKNTWGVAAASLLVVSLIVGLISTTLQMRRAQAAEQTAQQQQIRAEQLRIQAEKNARQAQQERDSAEQQRLIAQTVRDFLQNRLLRQANPWVRAMAAPGEISSQSDLTVRELLERAAEEFSPERIQQKFPNQIGVQCEVLETLAETYESCGDNRRSLALQKFACRLRDEHEGPTAPNSLKSQINLAFMCLSGSRQAEAVQTLGEVVTRLEELLAREARENAEDDSAGSRALAATVEAVAHRSDPRLFSYPGISLGLLEGAAILVQVGRAIPRLENLNQITRARFGTNHRFSLVTHTLVGLAHHGLNQREAAISHYQEVLNASAAAADYDPMLLISLKMVLSFALRESGDQNQARALQLSREIYTALQAFLSEEHPATQSAKVNLAQLLFSQGDVATAEAMVREAWDYRRRAMGAEHPATLDLQTGLAEILLELQRNSEALVLLEPAFAQQQTLLGDAHRETLKTRLALTRAQRSTQQFEPALELLESGWEIARQHLGPRHATTEEFLLQTGYTLLEAGNTPAALEKFQQFRDDKKRSRSANGSQYAVDLFNIADALFDQGELTAATSYFQACRELESELGPPSWSTWLTVNRLGQCLSRQQQFAAADPLLTESLEQLLLLREQIPADERFSHLRGAWRSLNRHYREWNRPEALAPWRERIPPELLR